MSLDARPTVDQPDDDPYLWLEDIELGQHGKRRHVGLRCRNYLAAFRVVAESDLVLTLTARYAKLLTGGSGVRVLPMPLRMPTLDLFLYWHDRVHDDPANRWLRAALIEALGKVALMGKTARS